MPSSRSKPDVVLLTVMCGQTQSFTRPAEITVDDDDESMSNL